jgi:hypothetical protein
MGAMTNGIGTRGSTTPPRPEPVSMRSTYRRMSMASGAVRLEALDPSRITM